MEILFWTIAGLAVIGLVVYYLISQKGVSIPGISKKEKRPEAPFAPGTREEEE